MAQCGTVNFTPNTRTGCQGYQLNLQNITPGGSNTNWTTVFDDGTTITTTNNNQATRIASVCGKIRVYMTTTVNGNVCTKVDSNIIVNCPPVIRGNFTPHSVCVGQPVCYTDTTTTEPTCTPLQYFIDWGQSPIDSVPGCRRYTLPGLFSPNVIVRDACGCVASHAFTGASAVNVTAPPVASFTGTHRTSCASPLVSTMTATAGIAGTRYQWYINNSATPAQSGTSNIFTHSYAAGTYSIRLVTIDSLTGCSDTMTRASYVTAGSFPAACYTANVSSGCVPKTVNYCACSPGALSYVWDFPGGNPSSYTATTNGCINVSYTTAGSYSAQLIVYYNGGCVDTLNQSNVVTLGQPLTLGIATSDSFSCTVPFTAHLTYTGQACPTCTFSWSPPGNSTPTSPTGTDVTFTTFQTYSPVLRVTDAYGCISTLIKNNFILVQKLKAKATVRQLRNGCVNDSFLVVNTTAGRPFSSVVASFPGGTVSSPPGSQDSFYVRYATAGCHRYTMIVATASGCRDTLRDSICVSTKPLATLTVGPHDLCFEELCNTFTLNNVAGSDTPTSAVVWPEGLASNTTFTLTAAPGAATTTCYFYQNIGTFTPCFVPKNNQCVGDTVCLPLPGDTIRIKAPAASFTKVLSCSGGNSISFLNTSKMADHVQWEVDGVGYPTQGNLSVTLTGACGTQHIVKLTAYNYSTNCIHSKSDTFTLPCVGFDFTALGTRKGCANPGYTDSLKLITINPSANQPANIAWYIGLSPNPNFNGVPVSNTGPGIRLVSNTVGLLNVCTQLTYAGGCIDTICKLNYISISRPTARFTVSDTAGCSPLTVQFANTSSFLVTGQAQYTWSFGDNSPVNTTTPNPTNTYTGANDYIATLTVIDSNNCPSLASRHIISNDVHADFSMSDTITCHAVSSPRNPIRFTSTSTGFIAHYQWLLPAALGPTNANPGNVSTFSSQFTQQGTGDVCLIAIDQYNVCKDTICKRVTVKDPVADYTFSNLRDTINTCPQIIVNPFIDLSLNDICTCYWDFGDGSHFDTACDASHIYIRPGIYPITHIVTSCHGCSDTIVKYTIRAKGPVVKLTAESTGGCPCIPIKFYISSYDADSLEIYSGNGTQLFTQLRVVRGTMANPTVDSLTFTYCGVGDNFPFVYAFDLSDTNSPCRQRWDLTTNSGDSQILVVDTPTVAFNYISAGCGTKGICFNDQTTYTASQAYTIERAWDFGDGTPVDSTPSPCHTYALPGNYTVSLFIRNNVTCSNILTHQIHVAEGPRALIEVDDTVGCVPLLTHFRDSSIVDDSTSIVSGYWTFGDGTGAATFADTSHNYTVANTPPAVYTISLIITDGYGCSDTATQDIFVKPTATLALGGPSQLICLGDTVTLTASGSAPLFWESSYNIDTTNTSAVRVWPRVDTVYIVRAGDVPRCYRYDSVQVNVSTITASDTATLLCLGQATILTATATTTHATISSYLWHFGDGSTASGAQVTHVFPGYGTYVDSLIVVNSLGCSDTTYRSVTIGDKPHAAITLSDPSICLGAPVTVTNASTPGSMVGLSGFTIDMQPDGVADYTTSPVVHSYTSVGNFTIVLIQTDLNGCADTAREPVVIHNNPRVTLKSDSNCILLPNRLTGVFALGDGTLTHYNWTINGVAQTNSDSSVISRIFSTPGLYNICLSVSDAYNCKSPDSCSVLTIITQPTDTIDPMDTTVCLGYSASFHARGLFTSIKWVPSVWLDNDNTTDVVSTPRQPMRYLVYANFGHCVPKVDTVNIFVVDSVPVEAAANPENIILGLSSNVTSTVKGIIDSIVWDPDSTLNCRNCPNPVAKPSQTTTYTATIYYSKNGFVCSNRASVTVNVITSCDNSLIYVPNTFTPNNDGTNDVFRIRGQGISKVNYFRVYDRWGKLVYEAKDAESPDDAEWNGGLKNDRAKPENSGVFVYSFEIQCITGQTINGKGNVTLIR